MVTPRAKQEIDDQSGSKGGVLLVGGAGYIGSSITPRLLNSGYMVHCLDNLIYGNHFAIEPYTSHPAYHFHHDDLNNSQRVSDLLPQVSYIVILAGLVGDPITKKYPEASKAINENGILNFIRQCQKQRQEKTHDLKKLVFVSTCSNYGLIPEESLADENYPLNPLSAYAKAKVKIESHVMSLKGKIDYCPTILRFATAFGLSPRMRFDLTVNEFTRELAEGNDLLVYDAETWRPYCHVQDFGRAIIKVFEAPESDVSFEVFNAGGESGNHTKQMIIESITEQLPNVGKIKYQRHGSDPRNYRVDFSKIKKRLNFVPEYSVNDGIKETLAAIKNGDFKKVAENPNLYGNYEVTYP